MDEALHKLLSLLAREYHLQAVSKYHYPNTYALHGDDGPFLAKTPRDVILNYIMRFDRLHTWYIDDQDAKAAFLELGEVASLAWTNNIDISIEFTDTSDYDHHYQYSIWHTFRRYALWILEKVNKKPLNVGVDDLIDFIWDFETTNVENPNP